LLATVRRFFEAHHYWEVETPLLSHDIVIDAHLEPFSTIWTAEPAVRRIAAESGSDVDFNPRDGHVDSNPSDGNVERDLFLQTSPEFGMKRLVSAGATAIYQITRAFRNAEYGRYHNPEFTMIEWYRLDFGAGEMEHDVDRVLRVACAELRSFPPARSVSYRAAMLEGCGIDCLTATIAEIRAVLAARGVEPVSAGGWERDEWLDLLMGAVVGPGLGHGTPVFVNDYPPAQAALARLRVLPDGSQVAERFELYVDGLEIANGFRELGDATEQRRRFEQDQATRRRRGQPQRPIDERLLAGLASGLPDCSGVALGFDRLVMAAHRLPALEAAMAFAAARA